MPPPTIQRKLGFLERPWLWLASALLGSAAIAAAGKLAADGKLDAIFAQRAADHALRGYTPAGLFLGIASVILTVLAALYSLRKRPLQERLPGRGTMTAWLWLHVAASLLALAATVVHAGYGLVSAEPSTGKVLAAIFFLLALSGLVWRIAYAVVPPRAERAVGNYAAGDSAHRAEALTAEIAKVAAGGSSEIHRLEAWLLEAPREPADVERAAAALDPAERPIIEEMARLAASRRRALARMAQQNRYARLLQIWRVAHVPLTFLFFPALAVHIVFALDLHLQIGGPGDAPRQEFSGFHRSKECASCHRAIYEQWSSSMHAHALRSPVTIAQNNQLLEADLRNARSPDPRRFCVNCHGPVAVAASGKTRLPLRRVGYEDALLDEGIGCATCHQWRGTESPGGAGLARFQDGLRPGSTYFGAFADPVGNAFHKSRQASIFSRDGALCANCHNVQYDTDGDGKIVKGVDLVLQTTQQEYEAYAAKGGRPTCIGCHMPVRSGERAAERAAIPTQQDREAPPRVLHDHTFVGVDYPIDEVATRDPQRAAREALLRGAARMDVTQAAAKNGELTWQVSITNSGVGHNLPSGFAFARQMWLEIKVTGEGGKVLFSSGILARNSDDLCDAGTLDDPGNPAKPFVVGCKAADKQLVSFQQKLVDRIDVERGRDGQPKLDARGDTKPIAAKGAKEAWIQHLTAGAVPRVRPRDGAVLSPLAPEETRSFGYAAPVGDAKRVTLSVRLLFRSLAPYMLRAIGAGQKPEEKQLAPLVENLQVVEMAAKTITVDAPQVKP